MVSLCYSNIDSGHVSHNLWTEYLMMNSVMHMLFPMVNREGLRLKALEMKVK